MHESTFCFIVWTSGSIQTENYGFKVFAVLSTLLNGFSGHFTVQLGQIGTIGSLFYGHTTCCRTRCYAEPYIPAQMRTLVLIVGAVAKFLMPGRDPGGWIITIVLGIAGAVVGGMLGRAVGWYGPNDAAGFLMALVGALVLLGLYRLTLRRDT